MAPWGRVLGRILGADVCPADHVAGDMEDGGSRSPALFSKTVWALSKVAGETCSHTGVSTESPGHEHLPPSSLRMLLLIAVCEACEAGIALSLHHQKRTHHDHFACLAGQFKLRVLRVQARLS